MHSPQPTSPRNGRCTSPALSLNIRSPLKRTKDLKKLFREGLPKELRRELWNELSGATRKRQEFDDVHFKNLVELFQDFPSEAAKAIETDIPRTFVGANRKSLPNGCTVEECRHNLRTLLKAYSWHNRDIGYCQSLAYVGEILIFTNQFSLEEAFWVLTCLVEDILQPDYYTTTMNGAMLDTFVFKRCLETYLPKINALLDSFTDSFCPVILKWFTCIFSGSLPIDVTLRVWDSLIFEGDKVLFRIGLALFKLREAEILKASDFGEVLSILNKLPSTLTPEDEEEIFRRAFTTFKPLTKKEIARLRDECKNSVLNNEQAPLDTRLSRSSQLIIMMQHDDNFDSGNNNSSSGINSNNTTTTLSPTNTNNTNNTNNTSSDNDVEDDTNNNNNNDDENTIFGSDLTDTPSGTVSLDHDDEDDEELESNTSAAAATAAITTKTTTRSIIGNIIDASNNSETITTTKRSEIRTTTTTTTEPATKSTSLAIAIEDPPTGTDYHAGPATPTPDM